MRWLLLAALLAAAAYALHRSDVDMLALMEDSEIVGLAAASAFVAFLALSALSAYRGRLGRAVVDLTIWVVIAGGLVLAYSYRHDLGYLAYRVAGELLPPGRPIVSEERGESGDRAVRIRRRNDGHFVARTELDGIAIHMLVDTGATTVVLRSVDAKAVGIDMARLSYSVPVQTANGTAFAAAVRLPSIAIGPIVMTQVEALVAQPGALKESLLGMSFLRRLRSYEFSGDFLTFRG